MLDLSKLLHLSTVQKYDDRDVIVSEGETSDNSMYIMLQGKARVIKDYQMATQTILTEINSGDFFGEMSLFLGKPRSATVVAVAPSAALKVNQSNAFEIINHNSELAYGIIKTLCLRLYEMDILLERLKTTR